MITYFNRDQKNAIISGGEQRKQLVEFLEEVCDPESRRSKRHAYVGGTAGFGKSHSVFEAAEKSGLPVKTVKGQTSLVGLAQSLAVLKATHWNETVIVVIDDCDKLFSNEENLNAMKAVLLDGFDDEGNYKGEFRYEKNMHLNSFPEGIIRDSVEVFMNEGQAGFVIDLSNFRFIVTSNSTLPSAKTVRVQKNALKQKGIDSSPKIDKLEARNAVRTRCRYKTIDISQEDLWGSFASILMQETEQSDLSEDQKKFILNWMWINRYESSDFDYRQILDMCDDVRDLGLEEAMNRWDFNYLD